MNNHEIVQILHKYKETKNIFQGCFPADQIQPLVPNTVTIYNTENSYSNNGHWVSLFTNEKLSSDNSLSNLIPVYFDPFGNFPENLKLVKQVLTHAPLMKYSNVQYQSIFSELCGLHVIFVTILYCKGISLRKIFSSYYHPCTKTEFLNDKIVYTALVSDLKKIPSFKNLDEKVFTPLLTGVSNNGST